MSCWVIRLGKELGADFGFKKVGKRASYGVATKKGKPLEMSLAGTVPASNNNAPKGGRRMRRPYGLMDERKTFRRGTACVPKHERKTSRRGNACVALFGS